jgi:transcriptional regulator with XRE-family HTH domain
MNELSLLLKKLRGKESLRDVSKRAGISHNYLSILEKGIDPQTKAPVNPSPDTLKRLAKAYNYPYEELLAIAGVIDDPNDQPKDKDTGFAFFGGGDNLSPDEIEIAKAAARAAVEGYRKGIQDKKKD